MIISSFHYRNAANHDGKGDEKSQIVNDDVLIIDLLNQPPHSKHRISFMGVRVGRKRPNGPFRPIRTAVYTSQHCSPVFDALITTL